MIKIIGIILGVLLLAWLGRSYFGNRNIERPTIISSKMLSGGVELREIAPSIQATVISSGDQNTALYDGFNQLAGYIFGDNTSQSSVAMTAPVASSKSEPVAMTAPVGTQKLGEQYRISFTMPSSYTLETLPKPNNPRIRFEQIPATTYYVRKFSGVASAKRTSKELEAFQKALTEQGITPLGTPILNQYNDPRTIRFMRTNERRIAQQ